MCEFSFTQTTVAPGQRYCASCAEANCPRSGRSRSAAARGRGRRRRGRLLPWKQGAGLRLRWRGRRGWSRSRSRSRRSETSLRRRSGCRGETRSAFLQELRPGLAACCSVGFGRLPLRAALLHDGLGARGGRCSGEICRDELNFNPRAYLLNSLFKKSLSELSGVLQSKLKPRRLCRRGRSLVRITLGSGGHPKGCDHGLAGTRERRESGAQGPPGSEAATNDPGAFDQKNDRVRDQGRLAGARRLAQPCQTVGVDISAARGST